MYTVRKVTDRVRQSVSIEVKCEAQEKWFDKLLVFDCRLIANKMKYVPYNNKK